MSENIIVALIGAIGSVVGALIGAYLGKQHPKPVNESATLVKETQGWLRILIGAILGAIVTLSVLVIFGFTSLPSFFTTDVYDNFENTLYEGEFNTHLWIADARLPNFIEQENGVLTTSVEPTFGEAIYFYSKQRLGLKKDNYVQGKILLSSKTPSGEYIDTGIALIATDKTGNEFTNLCVIARDGGIKIWCEIYGEHPDRASFSTEKLLTSLDTWHTFRIEITRGVVVTFYIDGKNMGSYQPSNAEDFINRGFIIRIGTYTPEQTGIISQIDDIKVGQSE